MQAFPLLFALEVVHGYFADPRRCRLSFQPDAASADWLARAGAVIRPLNNALQVYYAAGDGRPPRAQTGEATALNFAVRALDPLFGLYTDGLAATDGIAPGSAPALVFDSAGAIQDGAGGAWLMGPSPPPAPAPAGNGLNVRPDFQVTLRLAGDLSDAGRLYRVALSSRATVWKYLLTGDWAEDRPCAVDASPANGAAPAKATFDPPGPAETLADGRPALAIRSTAPIPLAERPGRRIELWSRTEAGGQDRVLIRSLPAAAAANLALEDPADPASLVCEIFVSR